MNREPAKLMAKERLEQIIRAIDSEAYDEEEILRLVSSDEILMLARHAMASMDTKTGDVVPMRERATFVDIPMLPRSGVTTTAISILKAERQAGKNAFIATTREQGQWLTRYRGVAPAWIARLGDLDTLSTANVIIVDDAELMEVMFSKIFPRAGGFRAYLSVIGSARVYWLTSGK